MQDFPRLKMEAHSPASQRTAPRGRPGAYLRDTKRINVFAWSLFTRRDILVGNAAHTVVDSKVRQMTGRYTF